MLCEGVSPPKANTNGASGQPSKACTMPILASVSDMQVGLLLEISQTFIVLSEEPVTKVIHYKYSKHWLSTVSHTIDCVCSKTLNHG